MPEAELPPDSSKYPAAIAGTVFNQHFADRESESGVVGYRGTQERDAAGAGSSRLRRFRPAHAQIRGIVHCPFNPQPSMVRRQPRILVPVHPGLP